MNSIQVVPKSNATGPWLRVCAEGLTVLATILPPRKPISETTIAAYAYALQDLSIEQLRLAMGLAARRCKWLPTPAELRELCGAGESRELAGLEAWALVEKAVRHLGAYTSVTFTDPVIGVAINSLGGWVRLCSMEAHEFDVHARREFLKAYVALADSHRDDVPQRLMGVHEMVNAHHGTERDTAILIGANPPLAIEEAR